MLEEITMTYKNFEDYLQTKHAQQYTGLDDEMPDDYNDWLDQLSIEEVIDYADEYTEIRLEESGI